MKAFRITSKDQYVQDMNLNRGTYTFHAWVFAMGSNYSIGLKTKAGTWLNFNMADQIQAQEWRKVKITFTIYEPCIQFSLMNTFASGTAYVIVAAPMLEEGTNAGTPKPNELDLDESIGEGNVSVVLSNEAHVFAGTEDYALPTTLPVYIYAFRGSTPISLSVDDITIGTLPSGLTAEKYFDGVVFTVRSTPPLMVSPSGEVPITVRIDGRDYVRNFSYAISFRGAAGTKGLPGKMPIKIDWVQGDTHLNNDTVIHYIYYRPGNTWWRLRDAYESRVATASPSTTYYQQLSSVEVMVTKILIAEQGNLAGLIFKDNKLISQKGMINGVDSGDYANPAFEPYVYIDGETGEIVANKLLNPFVVADPDITGDLQTKLTNNHNIYLETSGPMSYDWKQHVLPGTGTLADRQLDGLNIKIFAPHGGGNNRIKIVPAGTGMIFGDVPGHVVPSLKLVRNTLDTIHLSAVWNRGYEVLDWVMTSRTGYRILINQGDYSEIRVPNVFKENDIIAKGYVSSSAVFSNLLNRYDSTITCSVNSGRFTLSIPRTTYFDTQGASINRPMTADQFDLQVTPNSALHRTTWVYKRYGTTNGITGVHFDIEFRTYNASTPTATAFTFVLRALDYVINNPWLDNTL